MNKSFFEKLLDLFCRLTTTIFLVSSAYISFLFGFHVQLRLTYVLGILGISFLMTVAAIPFFSLDSKISKTKMFIAQILYFIFVNVLVLAAGYLFDWFCSDRISTLIALELCVVVVYVIVIIITYNSEKQTADKIIKKIRERKM